MKRLKAIVLLSTFLHALATTHGAPVVLVGRVTTAVPFPRGLALFDGRLYVLCRGRVRRGGGVSAEIDDQAGTIYVVDPDVVEPISGGDVGAAVQQNGNLFAVPTQAPFRLWDRTANPPESDRETDRPYCTLRFHKATQSFYICCFSGIDKPKQPGQSSFSKNLSDGLLRYDLRTGKWYEVERHDIEAGGNYPHHDPKYSPPPHGWLNGPDNCLVVANTLYAVAKDNSVLAQYDLSPLVDSPDAGPPNSEIVFDENIFVRGLGMQRYYGHSALAVFDGYLYVGYRTSSVIVRIPIDSEGQLLRPVIGELVATFDPYDPRTGKSAELTDMAFDKKGRLYVVSAQPARIFRFTPNPDRVFDARASAIAPWLDLASTTGDPRMKSENILIDEQDRLFVTSGDGYEFQAGASGTVYRITIED